MTDASSNLRESATDADLSGAQLDDYTLIRRLARGAMAEVYLANQVSLRRSVAVKVLKADLAKDASYVKRFHNEAQAAASLVHANIVQIYGVGCADGVHYIAQEYVQGQNLREWLSRNGPAAVPAAVTIMRQVSAALQKAAERGIVHRDIKPENIMIARTGEVKVADFGLARQSGDVALNLTQIGVTMGTPLYMSPEQVEGRALDPRSDLYSFGVTIYQMLTGGPPFRGETALAIAVQHLKSQPERIENLRPDLPPALCRIVHKLLAKDPQARYENARELLKDLQALQVPGSAEAWPVEAETTPEERVALAGVGEATQRLAAVMQTSAQPVVGRRRLMLFCLALVVAFSVGGMAALATRKPPLLTQSPLVKIPKGVSGEAQFRDARLETNDRRREAWLRSVEEYFPKDELWVARSRRDLAQLFLTEKRYAEALVLLDELAAMSDQNFKEYKAFGLAGKAVVFTLQGANDKAAAALLSLSPYLGQLDPAMKSLVNEASRRIQQKVEEKQAAELRKILELEPTTPDET